MTIFDEIAAELKRARALHPRAFSSLHEAYAVLQEETAELWDEIRKKEFMRNRVVLRTEAIQIAAMAVRLIEDVIDSGE